MFFIEVIPLGGIAIDKKKIPNKIYLLTESIKFPSPNLESRLKLE